MNQSVIWDRATGITLASRPEPGARPGEVVVRVEASGLCGTDLHIAAGEYPLAKSNVVIGHEFAGTIVEVGPGEPEWRVGDRVVIDPNVPCGGCRYCHDAKPHLCIRPETLGVTIDGGMAQFVACPVSRLYRVPDGLSMTAAALTEPLACALHAVDRAALRPGDTAVVLGAGPIGLLCAALLRTAGASQVLVSDPQDARRGRIVEFGGEPLTPDQVPMGEADVVLECVGRADTMLAATQAVRAGGTVVWVGVAPPDATVPVNAYDMFRRELTIRGTYTNPFTMDRSLAILQAGGLPWETLVTHRLPLDRFDEAWNAHEKSLGLKVCVEPNAVS
ncbi:MAG TPA: alcohol dehydrogenase catalytic domain-containing protein [Thermomicrobiales bacterium]|nr:alcohol dehydrogenase catalytic domain-containing protein [Thermomicrobiales bacterium]